MKWVSTCGGRIANLGRTTVPVRLLSAALRSFWVAEDGGKSYCALCSVWTAPVRKPTTSLAGENVYGDFEFSNPTRLDLDKA